MPFPRIAEGPGCDDPPGRRGEMQLKALELFATRGFAEVGIRELAAHLGFSPGSVYHYIESKEALLYELIEHLYETLLENTLARRGCADTPLIRLRTLVLAHIALHGEYGSYFLVAEREQRCLGTTYRKRVECLRVAYENHIEGLMAQIKGVRPDAPLKALSCSVVSMLNLLPEWLSSAKCTAETLAIAFDMAMGAIEAGVEKTPKPMESYE